MKIHQRYTEVEQYFHQIVAPLFQERGFIAIPQYKQYRRLTPLGFQCVIFSFSHYPEGSLLEVHLGVRADAVEQLAFPFTNGLPGFRQDSLTLVTPMAKLYNLPFERFDLANQQDILQASRKITYQLDTKGWAFMERHSRLESLDDLFNTRPSDNLSIVHNQANRCIRGLTIAKLNQCRNLPELGQLYRQKLDQLPTTQKIKDGFNRLFSFLISYSPN